MLKVEEKSQLPWQMLKVEEKKMSTPIQSLKISDQNVDQNVDLERIIRTKF